MKLCKICKINPISNRNWKKKPIHCEECLLAIRRKYKGTKEKECCYCKKGFFQKANQNYCSKICNIKSKIMSTNDNNCWINPKFATTFIRINSNSHSAPLKTASAAIFKNAQPEYFKVWINTCSEKNCFNPDHLEQKKFLTPEEKQKKKSQVKKKTCKNCQQDFSSKLKFQKFCTEKCQKEDARKKLEIKNQTKKVFCKICNKECKEINKKSIKLCSALCRFKDSYKINESTQCHEWLKRCNESGTPVFYRSRFVTGLATKYAYLTKYTFDKDIYSHKFMAINNCSNTKCVNPDHIKITKKVIKKHSVSLEKMKEIIDFKEKYNWNAPDISKKYGISVSIIRCIIYGRYKINIQSELDKKLENIGICINCQKQHDNIQADYCSPSCMQEFLLK